MTDYFRESRRWETAVLLTAPLLAFYEVGLWFFSDGSVRNAADVVLTRYLLQMDGRSAALVINGLVLVAVIVAALRRRRSPSPGILALVICESAFYAVLLPVLRWVVDRLAVLQLATANDFIADIALRVGAGLYEELLFRLLLVTLLYAILRRGFTLGPTWSVALAVIVSAATFSGFHHWGELGEPFPYVGVHVPLPRRCGARSPVRLSRDRRGMLDARTLQRPPAGPGVTACTGAAYRVCWARADDSRRSPRGGGVHRYRIPRAERDPTRAPRDGRAGPDRGS